MFAIIYIHYALYGIYLKKNILPIEMMVLIQKKSWYLKSNFATQTLVIIFIKMITNANNESKFYLIAQHQEIEIQNNWNLQKISDFIH